MTQQAFVIGGTGQVGRAVAGRLAKAGWQRHLTQMAALKRLFDYEAEDTYLRLLARR
jgi:NAD(P)-dependent dehydrogenase (short-subunit alcohol dehydrogenase family)